MSNEPDQYIDVANVPALGDYTIEMWMNPTAYVGGTWGGFLVRSRGGNDYLALGFGDSTGRGITTAFYQAVSTPAIPLNTWTHVAVVRSGSVGAIYYNGVKVWTGAVSTAGAATDLELFGAHDIAGFVGNIDEFRISSLARYTGSFEVATLPFTPPGVRLTSPATNQVWNSVPTIPLTATPTDASAIITQVEFFNGGTSIGKVTTAPYTFTWTNVAAGNYMVTAKATDNQNVISTSEPLNIVVIVNPQPTINITAPANNAMYAAPANLSLKANAADSNGSIVNVAFYQGTTLLGTTTSAPYGFDWTNVAAGNYSVTGRATDNEGGITTSAPISVAVVNNVAPTISVTATQTNTSTPATIALTANAADVDGNVAQVEFFYNGVNKLGVVTQAPYSYNWSGVGTGVYSVTAKATDNLGTATTSAAVSVNVGAVAAGAGTIYYIHSDQINTPRLITNAANQAVWQWNSDPFGTALPNENPGNLGNFTFNPRFPGQYFDKETGLHYNYFRDYDPQLGRYVQSDPIGLKGGINNYAYVNNRPTGLIDRLGLDATAVRNGSDVTVNVGISLNGPNATQSLASAWQNSINSAWNAQKWKYENCNVNINVTVGVNIGAANNITVGPTGINGRSSVNGVGGNTGTWYADASGWVAAHETGHLMGEDDYYRDVVTNGVTQSVPDSGWGQNIMATVGGTVDQRNIDTIIRANLGLFNKLYCSCIK